MQIYHDVPKKIIAMSQPGYEATILERVNINSFVAKYL